MIRATISYGDKIFTDSHKDKNKAISKCVDRIVGYYNIKHYSIIGTDLCIVFENDEGEPDPEYIPIIVETI